MGSSTQAKIAKYEELLWAIVALPGARKIADEAGRRPLCHAAFLASIEGVRLLLEAESRRDIATSSSATCTGFKPLHLAKRAPLRSGSTRARRQRPPILDRHVKGCPPIVTHCLNRRIGVE